MRGTESEHEPSTSTIEKVNVADSKVQLSTSSSLTNRVDCLMSKELQSDEPPTKRVCTVKMKNNDNKSKETNLQDKELEIKDDSLENHGLTLCCLQHF